MNNKRYLLLHWLPHTAVDECIFTDEQEVISQCMDGDEYLEIEVISKKRVSRTRVPRPKDIISVEEVKE